MLSMKQVEALAEMLPACTTCGTYLSSRSKLSKCRVCQARDSAKRHWHEKGKHNTVAATRRQSIMRAKKYGLLPEVYEALVKAQDNKCAICSQVMTLPHVDHCHKTNKVRGLLCRNCNSGIGLLQDSPRVLQNAIKYLEECNTNSI